MSGSVAVFVDAPDWHGRRLEAALRRRGASAVWLSLKDCGFATAASGGLSLPGFADALPAGALVRSVPAGSFEQVTMRLGVLHALREAGVPVCNDARAIERCVDKSTTSFLLHRAGIPTPPTWTAESIERARTLIRAEARPGRPLVLKPLFGAQGRGLLLIEDADALPPPEAVGGVYYLQHFVASAGAGWRDWRAFVVGGRTVAAMIRHGASWRTNACRGAHCEGVAPEGDIAELATAAAAAVGADYAGVDIIRDAGGRPFVLEVNSMPAWKALQGVSAVDIAQALVDEFVTRLRPAEALAKAGAA